jgi:predicted ATPase
VGKTRLALEVAAGELGRHPDGVWLVELAHVRNPDDVGLATCGPLGLAPGAGDGPDDIIALVAHYLAERRALLVVDNAEHVVEAVAHLVRAVLARCPAVRVLVTSRELLHVPGEAVFDVPPLTVPSDATTLFVERARAASLSFTTSPATVGFITQVCQQLEGIPLAIELAAARVRVMSVEQIAGRLGDRFRLLVDGTRAIVPERHRTLRAALDWSHDLLTTDEQAALRRLAVFPGRFDLDAAVAVIERTNPLPNGATADGLALVSRLVDKSLLVVEAGDDIRFRLLDSIRHYGAEKLAAAGEEAAARDCHRDVFLERCGPMWPLTTAQERHRGLADQDNLRAALEWAWRRRDAPAALRLAAYMAISWLLVGAQGVATMERVLAATPDRTDAARARLLTGLAIALEDTTEQDPARLQALLAEATDVASRADDPADAAAIELETAETYLAWGWVTEAKALAAGALATYERLGATLGIGWCHHSLGWIALADSDVTTARAEFEQALEGARSPGGEWALPHVLAALGPLLALDGDHRRGVERAREAVTAARAFGSPPLLAVTLARAAETAIIVDEPATPALVELLQLLLDLGTRRWAADALEMSAIVLARRRQVDDAATAMASATLLRQAANERAGGIRAIAADVRRAAEELGRALSPQACAEAAARAHRLSAEQAMAAAVEALAERSP